MLSIQEAKTIIKTNLPNCRIQKVAMYKNLYIFQAFRSDPLEGDFDPFYSIDVNTGEFRDFSVLEAGLDVTAGLFGDKKRDPV